MNFIFSEHCQKGVGGSVQIQTCTLEKGGGVKPPHLNKKQISPGQGGED